MSKRNFSFIFIIIFIQILVIQSCIQKNYVSNKNLQDRIKSIVNIGKSVKEIKSKLGSPINQKVELVKNQYVKGQTDQMFILSYEGLEIKILQLSSTNEEFLVEVTILSKKQDEKFRLGLIDRSYDYVRKTLGEPFLTETDSLIYSYDNTQIKITFDKNKKVKEVSILPYID